MVDDDTAGVLLTLVNRWDELRESYMTVGDAYLEMINGNAALARRAELSRIAAAYEFCADGLREVLGELPKYD